MIIMLRRSLKSRTFKVIFWIVILVVSGVLSVFLNWYDSYFGKTSQAWILQINKEKISMPQFARAVASSEERIRFMRMQYGQYADLYFQMMGMKLNPQEMAFNEVIRKTLLNQLAHALPLYISADLASAQLNDPVAISQELSDMIPLSAWDPAIGGINPMQLQSYLQKFGITASDLNHELARAVKRTTTKQLIEHAAYVPEFELKEQFAQNFLGHKFSIATISESQILADVKKEPASDESLKAYYDLKNSKERRYYVPEKRFVKIYSFDPIPYGVSLTNEEIEKYYNNNKAQFIDKPAQVQVRRILLKSEDPAHEQEVKQKAESLRQELVKNPETFAQKAKELSQDSQTASQGGLLPYFAKGQQSDKTFERTSFLLKEDGNISSVIRTADGFEIVQRVGKKPLSIKPLAQVTAAIEDTLRKKKFAHQFGADTQALLKSASAAQDLEKFVKEKKAKESTKEVTSDSSVLSKTAYRLKKSESAHYQEANQGVIITITDIKETYLPPLDQIKTTVKEDYYKEKAAQKLTERLQEIERNPALFDSLAQSAIEKTGWLRHSHEFKDDQKQIQELQKKGINLGKMFQIENIGGVATHEHAGKGSIIRLDAIAPFDQALFDQKKVALQTEAYQQKKSLIVPGVVASLYRNAKINKNESQIRKEL